MRWASILSLRWRSVFRRRQLEQDLEEEFAFYLEQRTAHEIEQGATPEQAARIARLALDGVERRKEECRDARGTQALEDWLADLRQGFRGWRKTPGVWLLATLTLGLGIGANSSIFSLFEAIFHSPLAGLDLSRDITIHSVQRKQGRMRGANTLDEYLLWRESPGIEMAVAFRLHEAVVTGIGEPEQVSGQLVSPEYFRLFGTQPAMGRFPSGEEFRRGALPTIVISHNYWRNRLHSDPEVIGKSLRLDEIQYRIVAVADRDFWFPDTKTLFWMPLPLDPTPTSFRERNLRILARRKVDASLPDLEAGLQARFEAEAARHPDQYAGWSLLVQPVGEGMYSNADFQIRLLLYLISGGLLLISCANVANLLLTRGFARSREMAIRTALGASRTRIFLQSLTESLWIAVPAGGIAMICGRMSAELLLKNINFSLPIPKDFLNGRYVLFHLFVGLGSVVLFGLLPAWRAARRQTPGIPQEGGPRSTVGAPAIRFSNVLVVIQMALGLSLVMTAAISLRGVQVLTEMDPGYDQAQVVRTTARTMRLKPAEDETVREQILERLGGSSGIRNAGWISMIPGALGGDGAPGGVESVAKPLDRTQRPIAFTIAVSRGALETLRIPLQQGRVFDGRDNTVSERVAVVNRNLCDQLLPGRNPVGELIRFDLHGAQPFRIIGVYANLVRADARLAAAPQAFLLVGQVAAGEMQLIARYERESEAFAAIRSAIRALEPEAPVTLHVLETEIRDGLKNGRVLTTVIGTLAGLALFFAACGLFALLSQSVAFRMPEIGVRLALGASPSRIGGMILLSGLRLVGVGTVLGVGCGLMLGGVLARQLVGVRPWDWQIWLPSALLLMLGSVAAVAGPSLRAGRTNILAVMRRE